MRMDRSSGNLDGVLILMNDVTYFFWTINTVLYFIPSEIWSVSPPPVWSLGGPALSVAQPACLY